ncbi:MAG TPA: PQQ-binding-like beta-propeller repeat protein [Anaerolineales bacterium]|nr:PQQ-binding-like beta-propeller repeat protein [Anaerolineales bacterium]
MTILHRLGTRNWTLILGAALVGFMILIAILGPSLAPQDPMQENYTLSMDGKIKTPPYPAFQVPGYPLGTDRWGRDLLSRILWGVRPTMIMVTSVAGFRLGAGIILGLIIGWAEGPRARRLDSILSSLLSIPVLIVALIGIYAVGVDQGLWAFIFGMGITGWSETARMVSEQTRLVKRQTFVEAARALGAGERLILFNHILRQIMSLVWALLAFEISSTLLVAAELGFLDIFIGGGIWIEVSDFQAVNVAGLPELGQMLSTAFVKITDPSGMLIIGSTIFLGVLGFNVLGEGLRIELTQKEFVRRGGLLPQQVNEWLEAHAFVPLRYWLENNGRKAGLAVLAFVLIAGGWTYYQRNTFLFAESEIVLQMPGNHLWGAELHDPYGTSYVPISMNSMPGLTWQVQVQGGASGGPVVYADGTIVIAGRENVLLAFSPQGDLLWQAPLDAGPIGTPALDAQGRIFVADITGHVTAFDLQGNRLWTVEASATRQATSGPVVASNGMIYLTLIDAVAGISPEGVLIWRKTAKDVFVDAPPRLSPDEKLVYLKDVALDAMTGQIQEIQILPEAQVLFTEPVYFTGTDGRNYFRNGHEVMSWHRDESGINVDPSRSWECGTFVLFNPLDQGIVPNKLAWMFYSSEYSDGRIIWLDEGSRLVGNFEFPLTYSRLMAIGELGEAYLCGPTGARIKCAMAIPGVEEAGWEVFLENSSRPIGGALVPGTLYVSTEDGILYALSANAGETKP